MTDLPRNQHIVASGLVAAVGAWVTYISYTQEPAAAFLFPRMISTVFVVLALWTFGKALLGKSQVGNGLSISGGWPVCCRRYCRVKASSAVRLA